MEQDEMKNNEFYDAMIERAVIQVGNNHRIKKAFQKVIQREKITIAFHGGSITEQKDPPRQRVFATLFTEYLKKQFECEDTLTYINGGHNASTSSMGITRLDRDILHFQPDIVFLEFAENDPKDSLHRETFESMILKILNSDSHPAVFLIFMISETGYTCQGQMQALGEYYNLPMISLGEAIMPELKAGRMLWSEYADDSIHPNQRGHNITADILQYYFRTVVPMEWDEEPLFPDQPFYGDSFRYLQCMENYNCTASTTGSFHPQKTVTQFPNGWGYLPGTGNESFRVHLKCKNIIIMYMIKNDMNMGNAQIWIDGVKKTLLQGYSIFGWGNAAMQLLMQEEAVREHTIEIRMAPEDIKKNFSILALGYSDK